MEKKFNKVFVTSLCSHPKRSNVIALGFIHGRISIYTFHVGNEQLNEIWSTKLKQSIRAVQFSDCGALLFAVSSNKSFCIFDSETGQRLRCIRKGHSETPNCLCVLPSWISGQQVASGAEDGEIKTWDFRMDTPTVATFKDNEDVINSFSLYKNTLLAASDDCTLTSYDLHKRELRVKSETMSSELLSIAVTDKCTYVGASDSHIEVFKNGEYGNILERIETEISFGVGSLVALTPNLLLAAGPLDDCMNLIHVSPNKLIETIERPGGIDVFLMTTNNMYLISVESDFSTLKFIDPAEIVSNAPVLRAQNMKKLIPLNGTHKNDFFNDLLHPQQPKKTKNDYSDSDSDF